MMCTVKVRRLKPGTYDEFREALTPTNWPDALSHFLVLRSSEDPDQVCTIGYLEASNDLAETLRDDPDLRAAEAARLERVAGYTESVLASGLFDIVEKVERSA